MVDLLQHSKTVLETLTQDILRVSKLISDETWRLINDTHWTDSNGCTEARPQMDDVSKNNFINRIILHQINSNELEKGAQEHKEWLTIAIRRTLSNL